MRKIMEKNGLAMERMNEEKEQRRSNRFSGENQKKESNVHVVL